MIFLAFIAAFVLEWGIRADNEWATAGGAIGLIVIAMLAIIGGIAASIPEDE